jgi:hypothetical protein
VEEVIAVAVRLADGRQRYFLTWGRIQDSIDPGPVCELVFRFSRSCSLGGVPVSARLCGTLREAADSPDAPCFYESFLAFASRRPPERTTPHGRRGSRRGWRPARTSGTAGSSRDIDALASSDELVHWRTPALC